MKKQLLVLALLMTSQFFKAQIPNYSFENLNSDGSIKNWESTILLAIPLDTNGHPTDSLIMDTDFYFSSNDAHSGAKALEMRNAYWFVNQEKIAGRASLSSSDSGYAGFNSPVPIGHNPVSFSFYYKFLPANYDTAYAYLRLTDSSFNPVGEANIYIAGVHTAYTFTSTPVVYSSTITAAFMEIGFTTAKLYSEASYGTRFLVDDINMSFATTGIRPVPATGNSISCFPNPAEKEISLRLQDATNLQQTRIILLDANGKEIRELNLNLAGNLLKINTEALAPGLYFIHVVDGASTYSAKFVK